MVDGGAPVVFPVNYALDGDAVVFRTDAGTKLGTTGRAPACFEVDRFDVDAEAVERGGPRPSGGGHSVRRHHARTDTSTGADTTVKHIRSVYAARLAERRARQGR